MASKSEGAFPAAYAALLSAFYLPLVLMLCALILRGVSFEFRYKARSFCSISAQNDASNCERCYFTSETS